MDHSDDSVRDQAEAVARHLRAIRHLLRRPIDVAIAGSGLTAPQVALLRELTHQDGQSLKALSQALGLSHSTVSGIVDRLERSELVERRTSEADKRVSQVYISATVRAFVDENPIADGLPLTAALRQASASERESIAEALALLRRLLEDLP